MSEEMVSLNELRDWARSVYGICLIQIGDGWTAHLHAPPWSPTDPAPIVGPFPSPVAALAAGMHYFVTRLVERAQADLDERYTALEHGGLSLYREVQVSQKGLIQPLGTWGFTWVCGCVGSGYPTEHAAIVAALGVHLAAHHPVYTVPVA